MHTEVKIHTLKAYALQIVYIVAVFLSQYLYYNQSRACRFGSPLVPSSVESGWDPTKSNRPDERVSFELSASCRVPALAACAD